MLVRRLTVLAVPCVLGLLVIASPASAATTVLRGDPGNVPLPPGTTVTGTSEGPVTLTFPGVGELSCHANFAAVFVTTHGNPSIDGVLESLTFSPCTDTIPIIAIDDCAMHQHQSTVVAAAQSSSGGAVTFNDVTMFCHVAGSGNPGAGCYWKFTDPVGSFNNTRSTLTFPSVTVDHVVPTGTTNDLESACPDQGNLSMRFNDVHTSAGLTVTLTTT